MKALQTLTESTTDKTTELVRGEVGLLNRLLNVSSTTCADVCACKRCTWCTVRQRVRASNRVKQHVQRVRECKRCKVKDSEQAATARASACTCGWPDTLGGNLPRGKSLSCHGHAVPSSSGLARQVAGELSVDALFQREEKKTQQTKLQRCCEVKRDLRIRFTRCVGPDVRRCVCARAIGALCEWCTV